MKAVGIVANPAAGKDIRRLVAYGNSTDNTDKVNIVCRIIMGASQTGIDTIYYMREYYGIVETAIKNLHADHRHLAEHIRFAAVDSPVLGIELDTVLAVEAMRELGVACIVTLGGDGTNRAAAKSSGNVPIIPISTGTNNIFPKMIEGTVAGMAAGAYTGGRLTPRKEHILPTKRLEIYKDGGMTDMALVDAVVIRGAEIASRAMWKTELFDEVFLASCAVSNIGVSSIGGQLTEIGERDPRGLYVSCGGDGESLCAPLAPGLMAWVNINGYREIGMGELLPIRTTPCVIAVDGEREISVPEKAGLSIRLTWNGPKLLDTVQVLRDARAERIFFKT